MYVHPKTLNMKLIMYVHGENHNKLGQCELTEGCCQIEYSNRTKNWQLLPLPLKESHSNFVLNKKYKRWPILYIKVLICIVLNKYH